MANGNPIILGQTNTSTLETTLQSSTPSSQAAINVQNQAAPAIKSGTLVGPTVVVASFTGPAVSSESFGRIGVFSNCVDTSDIPAISAAVFGTVAGGFGVKGNNARGIFPQAGVQGVADKALGVDGVSLRGIGMRGLALSGNTRGAGVVGVGAPGHGVIGIATMPASKPPFGSLFAGLFEGSVQISNDLLVFGNKAAVVPHPDGSYRQLYCIESPVCWFEDFGFAKLVNGVARVKLEKIFAPLVIAEDYQVYLSPEGDCGGLYVYEKAAAGFEVRELQGGTSSIRFSYRIVARRKDIPGERLARVKRGVVPEDASAFLPGPKLPKDTVERRLVAELKEFKKRGARKKVASKATKPKKQ